MAISDKITSIQNHLKDDWDSVESLIGDTELDKNIENISSALDDLYNDLPKVTGSGTSITLDDTRKGRLESTLSGNTSQFTTTGKNKLDLTGITARTISAGITITPNFNGDLLQNIKISGTPTTTAWQTIKRITLPAGSYIMTGINISQTTKTGLRIGVYIDSARQYFINANSTSYSFTLEEETSMNYVVWVQNVDYYPTGDIYVFPMIRLSSVSDDTYEPFTNGASPNPDYPQEVHIVSGDNEINVTGRNLLEGVEYGDIIAQTGEETTSTSVIKSKNYIPYYRNTTYYLSVNSVMPTNMGINLRFYNKNKEYIGYAGLTGSGSNFNITIVTSVEDTTPMYFRFRETLSVGPITSLNDNVMITTVNNMNYEPYSSNSYPINLGMKNLWNSEDMKSGYLPQSGSYPTTDPSYPNSRYIIVPLMKGQSITTYSEVTYSAFRIRYIDKDTNLIVGTVSVGENNGYCNSNATYQSGFANGTITATKDVLLGLWDFDGYMSTSGYYKITYGTTLQQISPNPIELGIISTYKDKLIRTRGKNLFDKDNTTIEIGTISAMGTFDYSTERLRAYYIEVDENTTYTISTSNSDLQIVPYFYNSSKTFLSFNSGWKDFPYTFTTPSNTKYVALLFKNSSNTPSVGMIGYLQLEKGTTATDYEPYGSGEWYKHSMVGKVVLDGSENWVRSGNTSDNFFAGALAGATNLTIKIKMGTAINSYCDYFVKGNVHSNAEIFDMYNGTDYYSALALYLKTSRASDLTSFKNWLSANNVTIYYVLYEDIYEKITYEPLLEQLEAYYYAKSRATQTNIFQENNDLPFEIDASALEG